MVPGKIWVRTFVPTGTRLFTHTSSMYSGTHLSVNPTPPGVNPRHRAQRTLNHPSSSQERCPKSTPKHRCTLQILGTYLVRLGTTLFAHTFLLFVQGTAVPKRLYPLVQAYMWPSKMKILYRGSRCVQSSTAPLNGAASGREKAFVTYPAIVV